ncbi:metal ABC transporter permease [Acetobacter oeni]|uniref:High-affinity zinc uptake system membrane protein ZnuB n=1 Tax=Acetobacter oeni TaxID=304077 RepID=A0A511XM49_9PROT|nr:metal ABC transporter permease [Acetobacter oeni]MBB3884019.1 zinc/manganese transport system permease protein [Acetobacter oeni]NHO20077.1 metal ABC transporter permease [Acetobacter oeni]GBR03739.1 Mn2+/Zn2+ transporter permease [Acetobacter oeni LMG 21952]GEN64008.1 ABC transporter permease [Acetobacter oeni]
MLAYDFMRMAFAASACVALLAGPVGWFLALRGQSFAGHALSHIAFAGAAGAALLGVSPLAGLLGAAVLAGGAMGLTGRETGERDVAIGLVLSLAMGFGVLFLHLMTRSTSTAMALLFGNVLGVSAGMLASLAGAAVGGLAALGALSRPLLFASLQPELAEARGVRLRLVSTLFLMLVGAATAECAQITGVLLVFTLMVGPGAAAQRLGLAPLAGMVCAAVLALGEAWGGLALSWWTDWPVSFWIAVLSVVVFFLAGLRRL